MLTALLDLVCPHRCAGCAGPGRQLCGRCSEVICGTPFAADPQPRPLALPPVLAATRYDGVSRKALIAFKERGRFGLARELGSALAEVVRAANADAIVAVPTSRAARRARGYDHVALLAARASQRTGVRVLTGLAQAHRVADQSGLDAAGRAGNLAGSMRFEGRPAGVTIERAVIVDDIVTTGATLVEAARALTQAGVPVAAAAVVAATQRRDGSTNLMQRDSLGR